jgi:hypothetical protein
VNVKVLTGVLVLVASVAVMGSFLSGLFSNRNGLESETSQVNSGTQVTTGNNSPSVGNVQGDVTVTVDNSHHVVVEEPYTIKPVTLTNERFGFKSSFPGQWARHDPANDDGFWFEDMLGNAELRAYAGFIVDDIPEKPFYAFDEILQLSSVRFNRADFM